MRLFVALWPDAGTRAGLADRQRSYCGGVAARPIPPRDLHMTLAYIGEVPVGRVQALRRALSPVTVEPFAIAIDRTDWFRHAGIAWVGPTLAPPALTGLRATIVAELAAAGFDIDPRRFIPHVTLARACRTRPTRWRGPPLEWRVTSFALCDSAGGSYRVVDVYPGAAAP